MSDLDATLCIELECWESLGLKRSLRRMDQSSSSHARLDGRELLSLGSNNYLGLADHPAVKRATVQAIERAGLGSGGSRLTTGNFPEHEALEALLADWRGTEDAVLFDSGYAANLGILPALAGPGDLILSDELNHASIIDGCRLTRACVRVYPHSNMDLARPLLSDRASFRRCILVTDGIFSMDGDTAPLQALGELAREHSSWLVVDDAHGTGVMGPEGSGTIQALGVQSLVDVQIGTLSKAVGAAGGFAAGTRSLCRYLRHFARSFVFSTAMPPAIAAGAAQGVQLSREGEHLRRRLRLNSGSIRDLLTRHGFSVPPGEGPIIPVLVGDANAAMSLSEDLLNQRVFVPAIRYPSVPRGSARLRVTATAALEPSDLEWFDQALAKVRRVRTR